MFIDIFFSISSYGFTVGNKYIPIWGTILQKYKTVNENVTNSLSDQTIPWFIVSHFYSTFNPKVLGSWKGVIGPKVEKLLPAATFPGTALPFQSWHTGVLWWHPLSMGKTVPFGRTHQWRWQAALHHPPAAPYREQWTTCSRTTDLRSFNGS